MKNSFHKIIGITGAGLILLASCKKDESKVYFAGGTTPVLTSTVAADSIPLPLSDTTATAVTFSWTNPNYQYSNGISSMNVTYYLEFDTTTNFNSGADGSPLATVGLSSSLSQTYTVSQLNALLSNQMLLSTGNQHTMNVRIESFLAPFTSTSPAVGLMNSTPLTYTVTPYAIPPAVTPVDQNTAFTSDTLYITGAATAKGWMSDAASVAGQGLTRVSETLWTITLPLIGGQQFLIVPIAGNFNYKYATADKNSPVTGDTFGFQSSTVSNNFNGPTTSGTYTVTFNFQTGYYTITAN
jgi:starch-binding outer membrane protein SusE/F